MTSEEKKKVLDALEISAPVMAMTKEEFNNYIQTLNKIMTWLEQEPGHWIIMGDRYIKCSECGHITKTESPDIYHFCMVCGANMSENPTGSKPEISSYYGLKSYVRERSEE